MGIKNLALLSGLPLMAASALALANPAQAATFDSGQLDLSNLPFGNAIYTKNAIDFTRTNVGGRPVANPGQTGFVNVSGTDSLAALSGQAEIYDLFSPVEITADTKFVIQDILGIESVPFLQFSDPDGTTYNLTAFTRSGSNTGVQNFQFEGFFLNNGDKTFSNFAFVTGQAPVPITSTTLLANIGQIDDPGVVTGFTSYSGTILTPPLPVAVPEPGTVLGLLAVGTLATGVAKRKRNA